MERKILDNIIGWYGTGAILMAYALLQFGLLAVDNIVYQILNVTGALGIVYISFKKKAYQPGILNIIWAIIAGIAIIGIILSSLVTQPLKPL
ncbi:MAG: hypothetical protein A3B74_01395 [Candidatus Kerfeldbacteria bacterium RIFCSPHIGHO2_02_FULL_42_14]|uniref:CBU-0592-like domain-containing protein n=1 Tax=Candidatus Kerfeldbacteria bacterium RIFCSPHIGHO2_02_FULL_42_14 TaxID=1798540 RepID=A0A1G2AQC7_9BACT|nr:MAG: hypothetical protein A3B74_01395 [Candidatus Kerfeldbacteria bacterium RIFCSPHIGHO2_02_FULL_42_14]OGY81214.1 MAG: hypothetical protein A3E60_02910 [Candidatus Kerfeldbacteria bacterium RIFCSPHIGHO2_12_FULL_42_13]OGY83366.1 MAG: hypothetical protein A3I91_01800 [Candidatus Kerfeldbacteria bacterium RIFCSPLOWO2_02_FULL_42_19]OGY86372.1 MAG: hypothetical protein A3G01_05240 [Candidatus Kerfeldbacteria bacterium RIFCSPLOWO2_12_FULL_43_9]